MKRRSSLKVFLTILFLLVGIVPVLIISVVSLFNFNRTIEGEIKSNLDTFTNLSNYKVLNYCRSIEDQSRVLTYTSDVYESMNVLQQIGRDEFAAEWQGRKKILDGLLGNAARELGLARIFITNSVGRVVYDTGQGLLGSTLLKEHYVQAALKGSPYWSTLFFSDLLDENCLVYASPVLSEGLTGKIEGTINFMLSDAQVSGIVHGDLEATGKESMDSYLLDAGGLLLTDTRFGEYAAGAALRESVDTRAVRLLAEAIETGDTEFRTQARYDNYLGQAVLGNLAVTRLGDTPVGLVVEVEQAEIFASVHQMCNIAIIIGVIAVAAIIVIGVLMANGIARPLREIVVVASEIARGNLVLETEVKRNDEIGRLGEEFNKMGQSLRRLISEAVDMATSVDRGSESVSAAAEEMSSSLEEVSATINEFAGNVQQLSSSSQQMAEANAGIVNQAEEGGRAIDRAMEQMQIISRRVSDLQMVIAQVDRRSGSIGKILVVITAIADQTNLLALNAAIEAARAGEQGRGFAVVAEEVRKLAEQSAKAAAEIGELIRATQKESKQALENMNSGVKEVETGSGVVAEVGAKFKGILQAVAGIGARVNEAATAAEELSAGSEEMAASVQEQSSTMQEVAAAALELRESSMRLSKELSQFKYRREG